jgi:uncharacterized protein (DUF58 family)
VKRNGLVRFRTQLLALALFLVVPFFLAQAVLLVYLLVSLLCFLHAAITSRAVSVTRNVALVRLYHGQRAAVAVTVRNRSPLTVHHLLVTDRRGELRVRGETVRLFVLRPWRTETLAYEALGDQRGVFTLGPAELSGSDPLGLFPWKKRLPAGTRVVVYPRLFPLTLLQRHGLPGGSIRTDDPSFEDLTYFRSIREYQAGDDIRRVNWKVSARLASLFTMQYTPSLRFGALIVLDLTEEDYPLRFRHSLIEGSIEAAASLLTHCIGARQEAGLLTRGRLDDERVVYYPVAAHLGGGVHVLETLARIRSGLERRNAVDELFSPFVRLPAACRVYYVGPVPDAGRLNRLCGLKRRGLHPEFFFCSAADRGDETPQALKSLGLAFRFIEDVRAPYAG